MDRFDIAVIGAGHAGCEAALACARMGLDTLLLTLNLDSIALMPCNPAIGGTGKGHLVREIDALGGEMGRAIDDTFIQSRMLNTGKGPAVHSLRAQADKRAYQQRMKRALFAEPHLTVRQGECGRFLTENGAISGLETTTGAAIACRAVVVCSGVYMDSRIIIGECSWMGGPQGLLSSSHLAGALRELGISLRRFKTGTPPRVEESSIDFSEMERAARRRNHHAVLLSDRRRARKSRAVLPHLYQRGNPPHHPRKHPSCSDVRRHNPRYGRKVLSFHRR